MNLLNLFVSVALVSAAIHPDDKEEVPEGSSEENPDYFSDEYHEQQKQDEIDEMRYNPNGNSPLFDRKTCTSDDDCWS